MATATIAKSKPKNGLANLLEFRKDPLAFLTRMAREHGDVVSYRMGGRKVTLVNHPDYIKDLLVTNNRKFEKGRVLKRSKRILGEGLLTSEGEIHLRQRRLAQPAFHRQRIVNYAESMVTYADHTRNAWNEGSTVDMRGEMMQLTLNIVGKTLFNVDLETEGSEIGESLTTFMESFGMMFLPFSEFLERLPIPPMRRLAKARDKLDTIVYRIIRERRASSQVDRGDLLSMLLLSQDDEGDGKGMTDEQLRDECLTIILAGHETTANALSWTWMLLSQSPAVEEKLHAEIDAVLGRRLPTLADLPNLKYTEMVFAESMRLYPPAWGIGRKAIADHTFGDVAVEKNTMVVCSQWVMHRDPRYFSNPVVFDPERWTPEARVARPKFSYFPFGGGPRQCIGESFAWMEGVLLLATLAQKWRPKLVSDAPIEKMAAITLRPRNPMMMKLTAR